MMIGISSISMKTIALVGIVAILVGNDVLRAAHSFEKKAVNSSKNVLIEDRDDAKDSKPKSPRFKIPNVKESLKRIEKEMREIAGQAGFAMNVFAKGGLSNKGNHEVWLHQVYEEYDCKVRGDFTHVSELELYRHSRNGKGAVRVNATWIPMNSNPIGKKFSFLVKDPLELLLESTRARSVRWVSPPKTEEIDLDHPDFSDPIGGEKGTSVVVEDEPVKLDYDRIRIDMGSKVAVEAFTAVKNSGCIGGLG
ncbi:MAG: hypothetical protein GWP39_02425 [Planctomycetia bacterium]|nr:hypothetical protein [Planctomycetia bacterium]